jgi:hypothetical protein
MTPRQRTWCRFVAAAAVCGRLAAMQTVERRQLDQVEEALRLEGEAVMALADAAAAGQARRPDFSIDWHNDFLKAQAGTFVPFVVTVPGAALDAASVLLYLRLARSAEASADHSAIVVEEIYPVDVARRDRPARISRGFSAPPGTYELTVVVREREQRVSRGQRPRAAYLRQPIRVPDYSVPELTTSTIILAEQVAALAAPVDPSTLADRPYAIGTREVQPRLDPVFAPTEELAVVFLVYHPALTEDEQFDLEVEYHFFRLGPGPRDPREPGPSGAPPVAGSGERYVTRTQPQRFNPGVLGPQFRPAAGQPVLAGQRVPLSAFEPGDYRLAITVTDLVAGRAIARQVTFSVRP